MKTGKDDVVLLKKITFEARKGQLVAIVGKIGSGKSSLLALLTRLTEFSSGEIRVNGADIRGFSPEGLRARLGLVTQEPFILTDSVLNNITLGRDNLGRDAVDNAVRVSLDIARLPATGTRGALRRPAAHRRRGPADVPDLLLFDDATSAMAPRPRPISGMTSAGNFRTPSA